MVTTPSPYRADLSWLLLDPAEDQHELEATIQRALQESWQDACKVALRVLREPVPPGDLWENALKRTVVDLRERPSDTVDPAKSILRYFELSARRLRAEQLRMVSIPENQELPSPSNFENAIAAKLDLEKVMDSLSAEEREVIYLRFANQGTWREMAKKMDRKEDAVRKQCGRALEKIRARFGRRSGPKYDVPKSLS
jgi:RNA polymerase sigma factor (sigma-70 family)